MKLYPYVSLSGIASSGCIIFLGGNFLRSVIVWLYGALLCNSTKAHTVRAACLAIRALFRRIISLEYSHFEVAAQKTLFWK